MQNRTIKPEIDLSLQEIRYTLVNIEQASKKDSWTCEERYQMQAAFEDLKNAVKVLQVRCGLAYRGRISRTTLPRF